MINVTTPYLELTPNFSNEYMSFTSLCIKNVLNKYFEYWEQFINKYPNYILSIYFVKKRGTESLFVKGPTVSKKRKTIDYSLFLPDEINDLNHYLDIVFDGLGRVLEKYSIEEAEIEKMKSECKRELNLA